MPVYRNNTYSVHRSPADALRNVSEPPEMTTLAPPAVTVPETSPHRGSVTESTLWKSANPPLPSPEERGWPLTDTATAVIANQPPRYELSRSKSGTGLVCKKTADATSSGDNTPTANSPVESHRGGRWSWTNSQAPSTPRAAAPNARASLTSLTSRHFANLMRGHATPKEDTSKGTGAPKTALKNHATTPVLAPPRVGRKMSQKSKLGHQPRVGNLSMISKPLGPAINSPDEAHSPISTKEDTSRESSSTAAISPVIETRPQHYRWK